MPTATRERSAAYKARKRQAGYVPRTFWLNGDSVRRLEALKASAGISADDVLHAALWAMHGERL